MQKSKKVRMPAGIRNKLMAAVAMLLVSSIMMVSSTYAWFTLSTAPEVTGITTSVGANGNLEIALLTSDTYADMTSIRSSVGDSSAAATQTVTGANITWGNLVDLSDTSYGLTGIALMPAAVNGTYTETETQNESGATVTVKTLTGVNPINPLLTAEYGADGRVTTVEGTTVSGVATNGIFTYGDTQSYGVRAVGVTSNLSAREIAYKNAKTVVNNTAASAKTGTKNAIGNNFGVLIAYAVATDTPDSYTETQIAAFYEIACGVVSDLAVLENGYKNAAIAVAATKSESDEVFAETKATIEAMTLTQLATAAGEYGLSAENITSLASAQTSAGEAKATLSTAGTSTVAETITTAIQKLIGTTYTKTTNADGVTEVYFTEGAIGEQGKQVGTFELGSLSGMGVAYAGTSGNTTGLFSSAVTLVANNPFTSGASTTSTITDTYGYIIDFAFRTNAANSYLQLQTAGVNRVYSDQKATDLATQGAGSKVTFVYTSGMTETQVTKLLSAIRLMFLDTSTGTIYKTAGLTNISIDTATTTATANVELTGLTADDDADNIVALDQNVAKAISVLVYLDGEEVDNTAVVNAATSGALNLNLQFSSSAELVPMQNTTLQTMTAYTVSFDANGGFGIMTAARVSGDSYTVPATTSFTNTGYTFKGWATESTGSVISAPITLTADTTLYAIWEANSTSGGTTEKTGAYAVNIIVNDSTMGSVTATPASADANTEVTLSYTANTGYIFKEWSAVDANDAKVEITDGKFTMPESNVTVTATFEDDLNTVRVTVPEGVTGESLYTLGSESGYVFTVSESYTLTDVTVNGVSIMSGTDILSNSDKTYTIANDGISGDIVITVSQ